jgi:hypothetical protein
VIRLPFDSCNWGEILTLASLALGLAGYLLSKLGQ